MDTSSAPDSAGARTRPASAPGEQRSKKALSVFKMGRGLRQPVATRPTQAQGDRAGVPIRLNYRTWHDTGRQSRTGTQTLSGRQCDHVLVLSPRRPVPGHAQPVLAAICCARPLSECQPCSKRRLYAVTSAIRRNQVMPFACSFWMVGSRLAATCRALAAVASPPRSLPHLTPRVFKAASAARMLFLLPVMPRMRFPTDDGDFAARNRSKAPQVSSAFRFTAPRHPPLGVRASICVSDKPHIIRRELREYRPPMARPLGEPAFGRWLPRPAEAYYRPVISHGSLRCMPRRRVDTGWLTAYRDKQNCCPNRQHRDSCSPLAICSFD
jgi:hypothetical protein